MTEKKIKNNMSSSCLTRGSRNKDIHSTGFPVKRGMTKDLESGRSMVEMLGVLAIVGVLSVGGIAGYSYGMNKVRANEIVHAVSMMALTASQALLINGDFSLGEYGNEISGYAFEYDTNHSNQDNDFSITVKGVDEGVCEQIMNFEWEMPYEVNINGISYGECGDENDIVFVFTDDLGGIWEEMTHGACTEYVCKSCPIDEELKCSQKGTEDNACVCIPEDETGVCSNYGCISCPAGETPMCATSTGKNICICVPEGETGVCGGAACISCPNGETPKCSSSGGRENGCVCVSKDETWKCGSDACISCPVGETPKCGVGVCICVPEGETGACGSNACISCPAGKTPKCSGYGSDENACVCVAEGETEACGNYKCVSCSAEETLKCNDNNVCVCVPPGETATCNDYECISCPAGETPECSISGSGEKGCVCVQENKPGICGEKACISCLAGETPKCSSSGSGENACVCVAEGETGACGKYGCISCPTGEIAKCSTHGGGEDGCICVPAGETAKCGYGSCISCPAGETPKCEYECSCLSEDETMGCGNYTCITCPKGQTPKCANYGCVCVSDGAVEGEDWACNNYVCISCPAGETPICSGSGGYGGKGENACLCVPAGENAKCGSNACISCPANKEPVCREKTCACFDEAFKGSDGELYPCETEASIESSSGECSLCSATGTPRIYIDGKCYLDCRTSETPLISSTGSCYACDTATSITTDEAACSRCSELRTMENGKCVPKNCPVIDGEVYVKNRTGACTKCSAAGIPYSDIGHLEVCKAAGYPRFTNAAGTISYLCSRAKLGSSNADVCHLCNYAGSPVPRFVGTDNYCYPCSESTSVATSAEECAVCGGSRSYDATTGKCSKAS